MLKIFNVSLILCLCCTVRTGYSAEDSVSAMSFVQLSPDRQMFMLTQNNRRFVPWGFNYDHDQQGRLLEDYWQTEWTKVEEDFQEMKDLGANVVRIHLQFAQFIRQDGSAKTDSLKQLTGLLELAERNRLYLDITGLGCYHRNDVPAWYDSLSRTKRWDMQERFWKAISMTCAESPAVFCYDLMNEPILPGADKTETDWLAGSFGDSYFVQRICLDLAGHTQQQIARQWVNQMTRAIRQYDRRHLITVGVIPWAMVFPKAKTLFYSPEVSENLDFVSVHFYPKSGEMDNALTALKVYDTGKPIVIEEMFPLLCSQTELRNFILASRVCADGWISFYWGKTIQEYKQDDSTPGTVTGRWLEEFREISKEILQSGTDPNSIDFADKP